MEHVRPSSLASINPPARSCVVGDFEPQAALMLGCNELQTAFPRVMVELVAVLLGHLPLLGIVDSEEQRRQTVTQLCDWGLPAHQMQFIHMPVGAMWVRDFGPQFVRQPDGSIVILDADYMQSDRPECDRLPEDLATLLRLPCIKVPALIEGGNLLSNGAGLCLTTTGLVERNARRGISAADLGYLLSTHYGFEQAIALQPLAGEPTAHVDMFATFTSRNTVVVGQYDPRIDPVNADVLDQNAARLARVMTDAGPLKVERIPMPSNRGSVWRTHTNVIYANGLLVMPHYPDADQGPQRQAIETYARLLPDWEVRPVDASRLIHNRGSLRCVSMNIPWLHHLFELPRSDPRRQVA